MCLHEELKTFLGKKNASQDKREGAVLWFKDEGPSEMMGASESAACPPTDWVLQRRRQHSQHVTRGLIKTMRAEH